MSKEIIQLNPGALSLQEAWIAKRNTVLETAKAVTSVDNPEELSAAGAVDKEAKALIKKLASERLKLTRPLDEAKRGLMNAEKEMVAELTSESTRINSMMSAYATKQMLAEREAQRKLEQQRREQAEAEAARLQQAEAEALTQDPFAEGNDPFAEAPEPEPLPEPEPVPYIEKPRTDTNRFSMVTKFEVVNPAMVPREFLSVDESKIREFLAYRKKMGDDIEQAHIPGVKIWLETQVSTR